MTKDDRQAFEVPDRLFEYVRSVVDNRALATVLLFLLSLLLIGIDLSLIHISEPTRH